MNDRAPQLSPKITAFLQLGLSIHLGAANAKGEPFLGRATAVRVTPEKGFEVLVMQEGSQSLLRAIEESGRVALVMCQPTTHQTVQIKGCGALISEALVSTWPEYASNKRNFSAEIAPFGFGPEYCEAWFSQERATCVTFAPTGAWNQTPGPGAGAPMELFA